MANVHFMIPGRTRVRTVRKPKGFAYRTVHRENDLFKDRTVYGVRTNVHPYNRHREPSAVRDSLASGRPRGLRIEAATYIGGLSNGIVV
jgi:hypothetical protein